jgi:hypothetical protein
VSKFDSLLDAAKDREVSSPKPIKKLHPVVVTVGPGRPRGKLSDPDYEQITAYIRKDTHKDTKIALLQEGQGREFSELVEDLLSEWLKTRT